MTRTRTAFSLAMPSIRSFSYKCFLALREPREDKVAGPFCLESLDAILVLRTSGEKAVWRAGIKLTRKVWKKSMNGTVRAPGQAVYHELASLHFSWKGRRYAASASRAAARCWS